MIPSRMDAEGLGIALRARLQAQAAEERRRRQRAWECIGAAFVALILAINLLVRLL